MEAIAPGEIEETPMRKETESKDVEEYAEEECQQWDEEEHKKILHLRTASVCTCAAWLRGNCSWKFSTATLGS